MENDTDEQIVKWNSEKKGTGEKKPKETEEEGREKEREAEGREKEDRKKSGLHSSLTWQKM